MDRAGAQHLQAQYLQARHLPASDLLNVLNTYGQPRLGKSVFELGVTVAAFVALWTAMLFSLRVSYLLTLALALPAAGFLVRLFLIQHDCGHGSFFQSRALNDWTGRIISTLTLTPYDYWRHSHALHHASSGNLDRRGVGDITTLTVSEYLGSSKLQRWLYRLYRNPFVMFGVGSAYFFLVQNRFPTHGKLADWRTWVSPMATNAAIVALAVAAACIFGIMPLLQVHLPIVLIAAALGVWLFFVQHQFEDTYWEPATNWNKHNAALHGSSNYVLPAPLQWLTANIGVHHVHHLCSRIPSYRLNEVLRENPEIADINRVGLGESLRCTRLALWDEASRRLISFRDLHRKS